MRGAHAETDLAARAGSYGMVAWAVDGMDVATVEHAARRAMEAVRDGGGPHVLELRTYRFHGAAELGIDLKVVEGTGAGGATEPPGAVARQGCAADVPPLLGWRGPMPLAARVAFSWTTRVTTAGLAVFQLRGASVAGLLAVAGRACGNGSPC